MSLSAAFEPRYRCSLDTQGLTCSSAFWMQGIVGVMELAASSEAAVACAHEIRAVGSTPQPWQAMLIVPHKLGLLCLA